MSDRTPIPAAVVASAAEAPRALLRDGLLEGTGIVLGHAPPQSGPSTSVMMGQWRSLGARVTSLILAADEPVSDVAVGIALQQAGPVGALVIDTRALHGVALSEGGDPLRALRATVDGAWMAARALAQAAWLGPGRAGRVIAVAPVSASAFADAARAGLENMVRTLATEWARHQVTTLAIAPSASTPDGDLGTLIAYLCSPASGYFSGCALDLRGPDR